MNSLFDPLQVGGLVLPNRIIMAPMSRSRASESGEPFEMVAEYYAQRASAGLIISESIFISPMAKGYARTPGLVTSDHVDGWNRVTQAVHQNGGRIFAQLYHTGRASMPDFLPGDAQPVGPSAVAIDGQKQTDSGKKPFVVPRPLEASEILGIVRDFADAALRALDSGFDGVEIHAASGYLLHQFLDASVNKRDDMYGGSPANRIRFVLEVIDGVTTAIGNGRVGIKISPRIKFNGVIEPDAEAVYPLLVHELSANGIAYLHAARQPDYPADDLRSFFKGPYFAGSGLDFNSASRLIEVGSADAAVFGKPYIANPDLVRRFRERLELEKPDVATFYSGGANGYLDYPQHP